MRLELNRTVQIPRQCRGVLAWSRRRLAGFLNPREGVVPATRLAGRRMHVRRCVARPVTLTSVCERLGTVEDGGECDHN